MSLVDKPALQALTVNQIFDDIQQNKRCYARMAYMKNYFRKGNLTQVVLADWIDLMNLGEFFGPLNRLHRQTYWIQYNRIDIAALSPEQKQIIKDYYLQIFPFFRPGAVVPPIPPAHPLRPPIRPTVLPQAENLPSNDLVDKAAIRALNINQLFDEIQQNKECFARISFIKNYFVSTDTKLVLGDWITLMDEGEYLGQRGLRRWDGLDIYREEYRNISRSRLTPAQKQVIKEYYLRLLPFLVNPAFENLGDNLGINDLNNDDLVGNNINNNVSTIANNNVRNNNNAGNNNNNTRSVLSSYPRGGKRKQKRKTRKSKKTRKH